MSNKKKKMKPSDAAAARWDTPDPRKANIERKTGIARWMQRNNGIKGILGAVFSVALVVFALVILFGIMN